MVDKLPRWIWIGGAWLAFCAGMVNAVGLMGIEHRAVSHLTGSTTTAAIEFASGDQRKAIHLTTMILSFVIGAMVSGIIIHDSALRLGRPYGLALVIESMLLFAAIPLIDHGSRISDYLIAGACGLQNAMAATYSGMIVRTTHVTGLFTDVGIMLGERLRGHRINFRKLGLQLTLIIGFVAGSAIGAKLYTRMQSHTLWFPAGMTGFVGVAYIWYWFWVRRHEDDLQIDEPEIPTA